MSRPQRFTIGILGLLRCFNLRWCLWNLGLRFLSLVFDQLFFFIRSDFKANLDNLGTSLFTSPVWGSHCNLLFQIQDGHWRHDRSHRSSWTSPWKSLVANQNHGMPLGQSTSSQVRTASGGSMGSFSIATASPFIILGLSTLLSKGNT